MEKEYYQPGLSKDLTLVQQLKELEKNPDSLVFAALGERYRSKGLLKQALEILEEGLEKRPSFAPALVAKARCFFDLRRYADCLEILEKVLRQNPENIRAEKLRAEVFQRLGQRRAAIGSLTRVISLMPNDREVAKALEELENLEEPRHNDSVSQNLPLVNPTIAPAIGKLGDFHVESLAQMKIPAEEVLRTPISEKRDGIADSWSEEDEEESESFGEITFATRTIAELYLRQGLQEKAKKVLQLMLSRDSKDVWARETLEKLSPTNDNTKTSQAAGRTQLMLKARYLERLLARVQSSKRAIY